MTKGFWFDLLCNISQHLLDNAWYNISVSILRSLFCFFKLYYGSFSFVVIRTLLLILKFSDWALIFFFFLKIFSFNTSRRKHLLMLFFNIIFKLRLNLLCWLKMIRFIHILRCAKVRRLYLLTEVCFIHKLLIRIKVK